MCSSDLELAKQLIDVGGVPYFDEIAQLVADKRTYILRSFIPHLTDGCDALLHAGQHQNIEVLEALLKAGREASAYQRATQRESDDERFDLLLEEGVEVTTLDPEPFKQALKPVYDQFIVTDGDKALAAAIKAYSEK